MITNNVEPTQESEVNELILVVSLVANCLPEYPEAAPKEVVIVLQVEVDFHFL